MLCLIDSALCSRFCIVIGSRCKLLICNRFILYCGLELLLQAYEQSFVLCRVAAQLKLEPFLLDDLICTGGCHEDGAVLADPLGILGGHLTGQDTFVFRKHFQCTLRCKGAGICCGQTAVGTDTTLIVYVTGFGRNRIYSKIFCL